MSKEKVFIVDENDRVLKEKWRNELTDTDRWRIIAIWVENSLGEILLQQRSLSKDLNPGPLPFQIRMKKQLIKNSRRSLESQIPF